MSEILANYITTEFKNAFGSESIAEEPLNKVSLALGRAIEQYLMSTDIDRSTLTFSPPTPAPTPTPPPPIERIIERIIVTSDSAEIDTSARIMNILF